MAPRLRPLLRPPNNGTKKENKLDLRVALRNGAGHPKTAADALANTVDLARAAERLGYHRYWLAEHHNMPCIASAATAVVIGHVAGATKTMRVGAEGPDALPPNLSCSASPDAAKASDR